MNINSLDSDSLRLILEQLLGDQPLWQLIRLRAVCSRWKSIIEQICSTSCKSLTFVRLISPEQQNVKATTNDEDSDDEEEIESANNNLEIVKEYDFSLKNQDFVKEVQVEIPTNSGPEIGDFLIDLFPNVRSLHIDFNQNRENYDNLIPFLLDNLPNLNRLLLRGSFGGGLERIFTALSDRSTKITHFYLFYVDNLIELSLASWQGVLPYLEHFSLTNYEKCPNLAEILSFLDAKHCRSLHLDCIPLYSGTIHQILDSNSQFLTSLTHLTIGSFWNDGIDSYDSAIDIFNGIIRLFGQNCVSLRCLNIIRGGHNVS